MIIPYHSLIRKILTEATAMIFVPQYKPYKGVMLCFVPGAADRVA